MRTTVKPDEFIEEIVKLVPREAKVIYLNDYDGKVRKYQIRRLEED